jgi:hypothetical protein
LKLGLSWVGGFGYYQPKESQNGPQKKEMSRFEDLDVLTAGLEDSLRAYKSFMEI